jgi:hypothetical protein
VIYMTRTRKGDAERSDRDCYRTPQDAIDGVVRNWKPLASGSYDIIDLCCGDGRIGETFLSDCTHASGQLYGCDLVTDCVWAYVGDVFQFLGHIPDTCNRRLFVSNPPYGALDENRNTEQDRILREVAKQLRLGDEILWLLPDLSRTSATRVHLWGETLGYPLRQYQIPFRLAFERPDGAPTVGAASSVTWWNWVGRTRTEEVLLQDSLVSVHTLTLGDLGCESGTSRI